MPILGTQSLAQLVSVRPEVSGSVNAREMFHDAESGRKLQARFSALTPQLTAMRATAEAVPGGGLAPHAMLEALGREGITRVFCEGGGALAASLLAAGLVDTLLDAEDLLASLAPDGEPSRLDAYADRSRGSGARHEITLIVAAGTIYPGESRRDNLQGRILGSDTVIEQLQKAREDRDIEAVLLRVDSPGGSALASDLIWREV